MHDHSIDHNELKLLYKKLLVAIIFFLPIFINSQYFEIISPIKFEHNLLQHYMVLISSSIIFFYSGREFLEGFYEEMKDLRPGMLTLVGSAITITYVFSLLADFDIIEGKQYYIELSTMIIIMLIGHIVETKSTLKAGDSINKLGELLPKTANKIDGDAIISINIKDLKVGDVILVKPGEKVAIDGEIIEGQTTINESMVTGESVPVNKLVGDKVIGGTINDNGSIKVRVTNSSSATYLNSIVNLLKDAQVTKSHTQDFADKGAALLTKFATISGILTFIAWYFVFKADIAFSIERSISIFVVACPHSLGLAIPIVIAIISSKAAQKGILIRNRKAFELLASASTMVFDKTGTLTTGNFSVTKTKVFSNTYDEKHVLSIIASLESHSEHVIAKSIVRYAEDNNINILSVNNFAAIPGVGLMGEVEKTKYYITNMDYVIKNIPNSEVILSKNVETSGTYAFLSTEHELIALIILKDTIRDGAKQLILDLKKQNISPVMLTGDNQKTANEIASEIGIEHVFAGISPKGKLEVIENIKKSGKIVAMVGDGINDAPALTIANVAIAIGAGTEVAIESADVLLVKNKLSDIITMVDYAKAAQNKMKQNIIIAISYNLIFIPISSGIFVSYGLIISPLAAAILNAISDVVSIANSMLLKLKKN